MISRAEKKNFLVAHWDWLVAAVGVLALVGAGVFAVVAFGENADDASDAAVRSVAGESGKNGGVEQVGVESYEVSRKNVAKPALLSELKADEHANFLGSHERRVMCSTEEGTGCGMPIPEGSKVCPFCSVTQSEKHSEVDSNANGIPDDIEKEIGLDPQKDLLNEDMDKDGFTNREELERTGFLAECAKPKKERMQLSDLKRLAQPMKDAKIHPDYLDDLAIDRLEPTLLPFFFQKATPTPNGTRCFFFDAKRKNDYGKKGTTYSVMKGEKIGDTGFVFREYTADESEVAIKGGGGATKKVDRSFVVICRESDRKEVKLLVGEKNKAIETRAFLVYRRPGSAKDFEVGEGDEIILNLDKYKVSRVSEDSVTVENTVGGKRRTLKATGNK